MLADQFIDLYESTRSDYQRGIKDQSQSQEKIRGEYYSSSTILFCDFVGFTKKTEKMQPAAFFQFFS